MVFPARLGRESEIKREGRRQNRRSESGGWKRLLLSSLFTRRIGVFYSFFGSPVLCCRRRFLLPRRQVGVGLRWMQRFSGLTTLPERGVDSFSLWRRSLMNSSFFSFSGLVSGVVSSSSAPVGVGFFWMRRFSGLTTLPESGVDSFSGWRRRSFVDGSRRRYSRLTSSFRDARRT